MNELEQILKHEENSKKKIALVEESAKKETEKKEGELKQRLLAESVLAESDKNRLMSEKDKEMKKIEEQELSSLKREIEKIRDKKDKNMDKAVDYIIDYFKSKNH